MKGRKSKYPVWSWMYVLTVVAVLIFLLIGTFVWRSGQRSEKQSFNEFLRLRQNTHTPSSVPTSTPSPIPVRKQLVGGTHVFQSFNNCGPASLSMALSYTGITVNQQVLGQQLRPFQNSQGDNDDKSVTLQELAALATDEYGLIAYHRPAGSKELLQTFIAHGIPVVTRTWLEPGEDIGHYRVVVGYDQSRDVLIQDDSLQGKNLEYTTQDFLNLWQAFNYEFLVLVHPEQQGTAEHLLGGLLDEEHAWEAARNLAQEQILLDSNNVYARFNAAVALYQLGRYKESVEMFESVQNQLPRRMLWYQIDPLLAYYQIQDFDTVLHMTEQILNNQNRAFSELHVLRGLIFERRGFSDSASEAFSLAQRYNSGKYWSVNLDGLDDAVF